MEKKLIAIISTEDKSGEQMDKEAQEAVDKFLKSAQENKINMKQNKPIRRAQGEQINIGTIVLGNFK